MATKAQLEENIAKLVKENQDLLVKLKESNELLNKAPRVSATTKVLEKKILELNNKIKSRVESFNKMKSSLEEAKEELGEVKRELSAAELTISNHRTIIGDLKIETEKPWYKKIF
tara:strand:- start:810 stop:1154 length:345 start_codon:yes stop_codon:yes gene_type:complete